MRQNGQERLRCPGVVTETHHESFSRAVAAGVKVAMGTDSGAGDRTVGTSTSWC